MVNTFCANSQGDRLDCGALPEVKDIILRYEGMLGSSCHSIGQDEEDQIVLSLKGLRSIGSLHRAEDVVYSCYNDFTNSIYVRLAALDVIRTVACSSQSLRLSFDPKLMRTFTDTTQDSELRIGAYLALMACPQPSTVSLLKSVLMTEPVNQGNFISIFKLTGYLSRSITFYSWVVCLDSPDQHPRKSKLVALQKGPEKPRWERFSAKQMEHRRSKVLSIL